MKATFFLFIACIQTASAQLTITPGAQLSLAGNAQLTLLNVDLLNSGDFVPGSSTVTFTGNASSFIGGAQQSRFYILQLNKSNAGNVVMLKQISVGNEINFTSGNLDLGGFDADLGNSGSLKGEQETSHIIGGSGGNIIFTTTLNTPSAINAGNLGLLITSAQNLGSTTIRRGHQSQSNGGTGSSILRFYTIAASNNTNLNATLRMQYLEAELNGLDKNTLVFYEKTGAQNWSNTGFDARGAGTNYVEKNALSTLDKFTLSSVNNALPVRFLLFNTQCNGSNVLLTWKTAQEQNSHYFTIERSADAVYWTALGNIPAAGNAATESNYSYIDNTAAGNNYYRIGAYDLDGKVQYTKLLRSACGSQDAVRMWPNPASDMLYVNMIASTGSTVVVKLSDSKGALVKQQAAMLLRGNNLLSMDVKGIASGLYYVTIVYSSGQVQTQKITKQ